MAATCWSRRAKFLIGLSKRTTRKGAEALKRRLAELGRAARIAHTPERVLHFKTAASLLGEGHRDGHGARWKPPASSPA